MGGGGGGCGLRGGVEANCSAKTLTASQRRKLTAANSRFLEVRLGYFE